ncbi:MAG: AraC family transcriptional regulator [Oscillospiraceae bacterium]|nr:AraC family transcriptional regulator [Oscillospiraceae bacterium]
MPPAGGNFLLSLGFEDQHAFSRAFKKYWGVSPTDHRRSVRLFKPSV